MVYLCIVYKWISLKLIEFIHILRLWIDMEYYGVHCIDIVCLWIERFLLSEVYELGKLVIEITYL